MAFARFVHLAAPSLRRFFSWLGASRGDVDDLLQETFLRAHRGLNSYRVEAEATSWLLTIGRRVYLDHVSRVQRDRRVLEVLCSDATSDTTGSNVETSAAIADALNKLSHEFREAFVLVRLFGYSYADAAAIIGCPRGTVQSRVARARAGLIRMLDDERSEEAS